MTVKRHAAVFLFQIVLLGGVFSFGVGCSGGAAAQSSKEAPDWYLNPDDAYAEDRYLTAVASGQSAQLAQDKAFGNLARIFEADIEASQALRDDYQEVKTDGEVTGTERETRMITQSDVQANQQLLNSDVLERAQVGDTHYALVGMDRRETLQIYTEEIESNRSRIDDYREAAREAENPITRLAFLQKALVLATVNDRLTTQRSIVAGGAAPDVSPESPITALEQAVRAAQEECPVVLQASEDVPSSIRDQVGATLEAAGFRVIDRPNDAILGATIKYDERPTLESREEKFLRWTLAIELTDQTLGQTLETFTTERRAGALSEAAVQRRAHNGARTAIEDDFSTFLDQTLLNIDP